MNGWNGIWLQVCFILFTSQITLITIYVFCQKYSLAACRSYIVRCECFSTFDASLKGQRFSLMVHIAIPICHPLIVNLRPPLIWHLTLHSIHNNNILSSFGTRYRSILPDKPRVFKPECVLSESCVIFKNVRWIKLYL